MNEDSLREAQHLAVLLDEGCQLVQLGLHGIGKVEGALRLLELQLGTLSAHAGRLSEILDACELEAPAMSATPDAPDTRH
jgi:hypothetical protein